MEHDSNLIGKRGDEGDLKTNSLRRRSQEREVWGEHWGRRPAAYSSASGGGGHRTIFRLMKPGEEAQTKLSFWRKVRIMARKEKGGPTKKKKMLLLMADGVRTERAGPDS